MNKYLAVALALAVFCPSAAAAQRKKKSDEKELPRTAWVQNMNEVQQVDSGCFVYALPRTVLYLKVEVERRIFSAGPYAAYAEKYLGVTGVQTASSVRYYLSSAALSSDVEADAQHLYMVQPVGSMSFNFLKMTKDGLMLLPESFGRAEAGSSSNIFGSADRPSLFTGMAVDAMFRTVKSKSKKMFADTTEYEDINAEKVEAPASISQQAKTPEERASEVAQLIFNLRKRKYELVTGEVDVAFSSNDGLKVALSEINRMESEYLSLFVGKTVTQQATYSYDVAPTPAQESYEVFKFSPEQGVQDMDGKGRAITLEVRSENKYAAANVLPAREDSSGFRVRLPDAAQVRLLDGKDELQRGRFWIYQNGKIVSIRVEYFLEK
ncbi:MAG: DUF4831 family protein [Prevotellaceae bacterium]|jgi:hypothetical protein|nr:DUF4831 family protein [Prevotellaceae bacterium]